jgi:hypothetical protein
MTGRGSGGVAFGSIRVEQGDVLYLALEDTPRRLQDRLRKLLGNEPPPERLHLFTQWPGMENGGLAELEAWLRQHPETRLVIADTLARIRPVAKRGAMLYEEDYRVGAALKAVADRFEVAVVFVHHTRKAGAEDPQDMISASNGLAGAIDGGMVLLQTAKGTTLHVRGRDVVEQDLALRWDNATCTWSIEGSAEERARTDERKEIIATLKIADGPLTPMETAKRLNKKHGSVKKLMWSMAKAGEIVPAGDGKYTDLSRAGNPDNPVNPTCPQDGETVAP